MHTESLWRSTLPPATRYRDTPAAHGAAVRTRWAAPGPHRPGGGAPGVERGDYGHLWAPSPCERPRWLLQNSSSTADAGPAGSPAALGLECGAGSKDLLRNGTLPANFILLPVSAGEIRESAQLRRGRAGCAAARSALVTTPAAEAAGEEAKATLKALEVAIEGLAERTRCVLDRI